MNDYRRPLVPFEKALLGRFLEYMAHERFASGQTVTAYKSDISRLMATCDPMIMSFDQFRAYMASLSKEGLKQSTLNRKLAAFRMFWRWLLMERLVTENVTDRYGLPRRKPRVPFWLTEAQLRAFVETPDPNPRNWLAWKLLAFTGLRRDELRLMRIEALKFEDDEIVIYDGKGRRDRRIPMPPKLKHELQLFVDGRSPDDYVFLGQAGEVWDVHSFYRHFRAQLRRAGLADRRITPHVLRHTYITLMARAGVHDVYLQVLSGHADPKSLVRYRHADPERIKEAALLFPLNT